MPYATGVDLGTTYSAAAIAGPDGVQAVDLGDRMTAVPSIVAINADGGIVTGIVAERRLVLDPARSAREFKRRLGDPTPLLLGGVPYGAETLTGHLLSSIVRLVTERNGEAPAVVGLSHPANYGSYKLGLLEEAARVAEIPVVTFVPEPVAAAVHYAQSERVGDNGLIAVYDLGGGTFDATVVRRTGDTFEVIGAPDGMDRFGGIDMDEAVLGHVRAVLGDELITGANEDPATVSALAKLREECRSAKEALSGDTEVTIPVMLPGLHTDVRLTRTEFEDMIRPRIRETLRVLERTISSAGIEPADLDRVLLVGGSSRIPLVGEMIRQATGRPVALDAHPKLTVALGAARAARDSLAAPPAPRPAPRAAPPPPVPPPVPPEPEPPAPEPEAKPVAAAAPPEPLAPVPDGERRRAIGGRFWGIAAAILVAAALVVVGVLALGGDDDAADPIEPATTVPASDTQDDPATTTPATDTPVEPATTIPATVAAVEPSGTTAAETGPTEVFRDDFDGSLSAGWTWINEQPSQWSLDAQVGYLQVALGDDGLRGNPANVLIREAPNGDFSITTRVVFVPSANFDVAGLLVSADDGSAIQLGRAMCDVPDATVCLRDAVYLDHYDAVLDPEYQGTEGVSGNDTLLRLTREGSKYTGFFDPDGNGWIEVGQLEADYQNVSVGLIAGQNQSGEFTTAEFDYFVIERPAPAASLDDTMLAFDSLRDGDSEIYLERFDGSAVTQLTDYAATDQHPAWSPDGNKIAFHSDRYGYVDVFVVDRDGTNLTRLTDDAANSGSPAWSPDGTQIAFDTDRDGNWEIYVMNADGSDQHGLTSNGYYDGSPVWSPDGTRIAFDSQADDGNFEIYVMNADGSAPTRITDGHEADDVNPAWSPDGTKIAFDSNRDGNSEIYVIDADGSNLARLTDDPSEDRVPAWSPDGSRIAFDSNRDGKASGYVMDADGSDVVRFIVDESDSGSLAWSPFLAEGS